MQLTQELKEQIDAMSYEDLLREWRFASVGDERFCGVSGDYWRDRMLKLRKDGVDHTAASKRVGWRQGDRMGRAFYINDAKENEK